MIISASRRCDLPAFQLDWLAARFAEGQILVRNPFNAAQSRVVQLTPEAVDGIVFWSKDPSALLQAEWLKPYPFYVQYTLNAYPEAVEPHVPPLENRIQTALRIVERFGPEAICLRYDPILFGPGMDAEWHAEAFGRLCNAMKGYVHGITISFLDVYPRIRKRMQAMEIRTPEPDERQRRVKAFAEMGKRNGIRLQTCAEPDLYPNVEPGKCIDGKRLERIAERAITTQKDRNQRPHCDCDQAVDVGVYGRCGHGCVYCYASR